VANNAGTQAGEAELAALHKSAAAGKELLGVVALSSFDRRAANSSGCRKSLYCLD